jgi:leader peptidase (prepilin peptidase) / N-methyltransferase
VLIAIFFLFGLIIGSFLNVCITRIPDGVSIVSPSSRCPDCGTPIKPYDNVPLLSWLLLRGKCRSCSAPISIMYPAIELLTGLLFVACYLTFGFSPETLKWLFFASLIIILIVTDVRIRILPDAVNWFGFGLGIVLAARIAPSDPTCMRLVERFPLFLQNSAITGVACALLGAAAGSLLLLAAASLYKLVRGREGMGMGDVKMMLMVGAFLGIQGTFLTLFFGTLLGSIIGLLLVVGLFVSGWKSQVAARAHRRGLGSVAALRWSISSRYQLPLGTFLGFAALLVVFFGPWLDLQAYRFGR